MIRLLLEILLPLVTPIALYAIWVNVDAKRKGKGMPGWEEGQWFWVIAIGVVLAIASIIIFGLQGEHGSGVYVPPHVEGGKVVPGEFK